MTLICIDAEHTLATSDEPAGFAPPWMAEKINKQRRRSVTLTGGPFSSTGHRPRGERGSVARSYAPLNFTRYPDTERPATSEK